MAVQAKVRSTRKSKTDTIIKKVLYFQVKNKQTSSGGKGVLIGYVSSRLLLRQRHHNEPRNKAPRSTCSTFSLSTHANNSSASGLSHLVFVVATSPCSAFGPFRFRLVTFEKCRIKKKRFWSWSPRLRKSDTVEKKKQILTPKSSNLWVVTKMAPLYLAKNRL